MFPSEQVPYYPYNFEPVPPLIEEQVDLRHDGLNQHAHIKNKKQVNWRSIKRKKPSGGFHHINELNKSENSYLSLVHYKVALDNLLKSCNYDNQQEKSFMVVEVLKHAANREPNELINMPSIQNVEQKARQLGMVNVIETIRAIRLLNYCREGNQEAAEETVNGYWSDPETMNIEDQHGKSAFDYACQVDDLHYIARMIANKIMHPVAEERDIGCDNGVEEAKEDTFENVMVDDGSDQELGGE